MLDFGSNLFNTFSRAKICHGLQRIQVWNSFLLSVPGEWNRSTGLAFFSFALLGCDCGKRWRIVRAENGLFNLVETEEQFLLDLKGKKDMMTDILDFGWLAE